MSFELPKLNYEYNSLEPFIDAKTMEIHHTKHHQTYINNLNKALESHPELASKTVAELLMELDQLPEDVKTAVRNNGGGHFNHTLFWTYMAPGKGEEPSGELKNAIEESFKDFANFKAEFSKAGLGRFGSGWAWLVINKDKKLEIMSTPNQDTPISQNIPVVLGIDVWEHAYYLNYQNRRNEYIENWWNVVDWDQVERYYAEGLKRI